jgi:hypothetical protein
MTSSTRQVSRVYQRTIAVGADSEGGRFAGSSNGFDAGQRPVLERLGIIRVPGSGALDAGEELLQGGLLH